MYVCGFMHFYFLLFSYIFQSSYRCESELVVLLREYAVLHDHTPRNPQHWNVSSKRGTTNLQSPHTVEGHADALALHDTGLLLGPYKLDSLAPREGW